MTRVCEFAGRHAAPHRAARGSGWQRRATERGVFARYCDLGLAAVASLALVVLHIGYKKLFAIADFARFFEFSLAERPARSTALADKSGRP